MQPIKIVAMKNYITLLKTFFFAFIVTFSFNLKAQTTYTIPSTSNSCDGSLTIDLQSFYLHFGIPLTGTTWVWTDVTGNTILQTGGVTLNNLCAGNYQIIFNNDNNTTNFLEKVPKRCSTTPTVYTTSATGPNACNGTLSCNPPSSTYNNGGNYMFLDSTSGGGGFSFVVYDLCVGKYTYRVDDHLNDCVTNVTGIITSDVITNPCDILPIKSSVNDIPSYGVGQCSGKMFIDAIGFTPFTYKIDNNLVTNQIQNLCPGTHTLKIIDAFGCESNSTHTIIDSSSYVQAYATPTSVSASGICDGSATVSALGGTAPYTFLFDNGNTTSVAQNLCEGNHSVVVTDALGATITLTFEIGVSNKYYWNSMKTVNTSAPGVCDGSATLSNPMSNYGPFTYLYSNGETTATASNLCEGHYTVKITDANGYSENWSFVIASPSKVITTSNYANSVIVDDVYASAISNCAIDYSNIKYSYIASYQDLGNDNVSVTWLVSDGTALNYITANYHLSPVNGVYTLVLQLYCPTKSTGKYLVSSDQFNYQGSKAGLSEIETNSILIYPNPVNDKISISIGKNQNSEVVITDITGKVVVSKTSTESEITIDVTDLMSGQYIVSVKNESSIITKKIVKL